MFADITEVRHSQDAPNHLFGGQLPVSLPVHISLTKTRALLLLIKAFGEGLFTNCAVNVCVSPPTQECVLGGNSR